MPRRVFDGIKLSQDIAQMQAADKVSPPSAQPSLMDVVRQFATYIDTRAKLGWTETMIAAVLTEAGYAIGPATLRSYCTRLRNEGLLPPLTGKAPKQPIPAPAPVPAGRPPAPVAAQSIPISKLASDSVGVVAATMSIAEPIVDGAMSRAPPPTGPTAETTPPAPLAAGRTFKVNRTTLPPDRA